MRWLVAFVFVVFAGRADAQVFKPRTQTKTAPAKTAKTAKKAKKTPGAAPRKSARTTGAARKTAPKKSRAARGKGRPSDLTPAPRSSDEDIVIIIDEDEDE